MEVYEADFVLPEGVVGEGSCLERWRGFEGEEVAEG